jgi:peptidoglycan biosynthesis protein MviN/MurJ (putative lipid II flippase)
MSLNYLLIPRLGLVGAAISTTTSLVMLSILRLIQVARAFPVTSLDLGVFRVVVVTVPLALFLSWLSSIFGFGQGTGTPHMLLRLLMMLVLISLAIWKVCLTSNERMTLRGLLSRERKAPGEEIESAAPEEGL